MRSVYQTFTPQVKPFSTVIYRRYRGVVASPMARKRYTQLVVGISKDTPLVFVHLVSVIGKGQYIPERDLPVSRKTPSQVNSVRSASLTQRSSSSDGIAYGLVAKKTTRTFLSVFSINSDPWSFLRGRIFLLKLKLWVSNP